MEMETTPEDLYLFCLRHHDDIEWNKFPQGDSLKHEIKQDISRFNIHYSNMNEKLYKIAERLKKKDLSVPFGINEVLDGKKSGNIKFWTFKEVAAMDEGKSFGELALMTSKPRAATI